MARLRFRTYLTIVTIGSRSGADASQGAKNRLYDPDVSLDWVKCECYISEQQIYARERPASLPALTPPVCTPDIAAARNRIYEGTEPSESDQQSQTNDAPIDATPEEVEAVRQQLQVIEQTLARLFGADVYSRTPERSRRAPRRAT